jgi:hypothetical protein
MLSQVHHFRRGNKQVVVETIKITAFTALGTCSSQVAVTPDLPVHPVVDFIYFFQQ